MKEILFSSLIVVCLTACSQNFPQHRLGHFTAASSFNVRYLNYDQSSAVKVTGEDCQQVGLPPNDSRLQRAMDNAIRKGQERGLAGDLLINVRIDQLTKQIPRNIFGIKYDCIQAEGDLVSLNRP